MENLYFRMMLLVARFADEIFTSSNTESVRITRFLKRDVHPVGLAISSGLLSAVPVRPKAMPDLVPLEYSLIVDRLNVRKNLVNSVLGAVASGTASRTSPVVVVGEPKGKLEKSNPVIEKAIAENLVVILPNVSDGELAWLYSNTKQFIFLSLDEGFGLPAIEASFFGAPILASDLAVFRELLGKNASFTNPTDVEGISQALRLGSSPKGIPNAEYNWSKVVREIRNRSLDVQEIKD